MEAEAIANAGLSIFVVYEDGNDPAKFGAEPRDIPGPAGVDLRAGMSGNLRGRRSISPSTSTAPPSSSSSRSRRTFSSINAVFADQGFPYKIGVYGKRPRLPGPTCGGVVLLHLAHQFDRLPRLQAILRVQALEFGAASAEILRQAASGSERNRCGLRHFSGRKGRTRGDDRLAAGRRGWSGARTGRRSL